MAESSNDWFVRIGVAFIGSVSSVTAALVLALGGYLWVTNAEIRVIQSDISQLAVAQEKTNASVEALDTKLEQQGKELGEKIDGVDTRLTQLEAKDAESDRNIQEFWEREWPPVLRAIEANDQAIENLEETMQRELTTIRREIQELRSRPARPQ